MASLDPPKQVDTLRLSPPAEAALRRRVRQLVVEEAAAKRITLMPDSWVQGYDAEFSRKLGEHGWLGMTWPTEYGGHERSAIERFVVIEELLASGAPVSAHWIADRQTGPLLLRFGTEDQRRRFLPRIAAGRLFVSAGLSEPDTGSDLASVRTRATPVAGGWRVTGRKIWTTNAHRNHWILALVRTSSDGPKHAGLSQMFIALDAPGVDVRPIETMDGESHFAEVTFSDAFVGQADVVGDIGAGWQQVTSELSYERSGPERYLSSFPLLTSMLAELELTDTDTAEVGALTARLWALRCLSVRVQRLLDQGADVTVQAALVKDCGNRLEKDVVRLCHRVIGESLQSPSPRLASYLRRALMAAPTFSLRGGTIEILRGIVAKGLAS
jgi:acyl-CoA dehydrogenase